MIRKKHASRAVVPNSLQLDFEGPSASKFQRAANNTTSGFDIALQHPHPYMPPATPLAGMQQMAITPNHPHFQQYFQQQQQKEQFNMSTPYLKKTRLSASSQYTNDPCYQ